MRSSGSTPNPRPRVPLRLFVVLAGEDHPKACTGRRLLLRQRAVRLPREGARTPGPVILDPFAPTPLSGADRESAEAGGLLVVDCSWNRLSARGAFPPSPRGVPHRGRRRRLPILIATNPQHYGRVAQLNTVEAFSAALAILGRPDEAAEVIEGFHGGTEFLSVNSARLARYRTAAHPADVTDAERRLFGRK